MPAPGDQHQPISNPFQQQQTFQDAQQQLQQPTQRVSEYTAQEIATLQSRLEKQLGPEYLSARSGPAGQKVHYIAAEKVIALANEVFGFNGWSSSIQKIQVDFVDEHPHTLKISVGLSVIVRVTLRDGTYHEDIGYGHIENCKGKAAAFEKAKKEGTTDALKRALRNFGNVLGNCLYDKTYVDRVSKMKVVPPNKRAFDERALHRHADYAVKTENTAPAEPAVTAPQAVTNIKQEASSLTDTSDMFDDDLLGDFDEADFCVAEEGHPDEVIVADTSAPALPPPPQNHNSRNTSPMRQIPPPQHQQNAYFRPAQNGIPPRPPQTPTPANGRPNNSVGPRPYQHATTNQSNRPQPLPPQAQRPNLNNNSSNGQKPPIGANNGGGAVSGAIEGEGTPWLSARAVAKVGNGDALAAVGPAVQTGHLFNPKAESPSIRKTPGFDHNTSKPIPRMSRPVSGGLSASAIPATDRASTPTSAARGGLLNAAATSGPPAAPSLAPGPARGSINHPMPEPARRIGAPPSAASPLANRGQFRPPPMKRGPPTDSAAGANRPPLADVPSNIAMNGATAVAAGGADAPGVDAKRQKLA